MDIYQTIWNADLEAGAGIRAYIAGTVLSAEQKAAGYILVNESPSGGQIEDHQLLPEVVIPEAKKASYDRVAALFNNYVLDQTKEDDLLPEESGEVQIFLSEAVKSASHLVAREFYAQTTGSAVSEEQWWAMIERVWFERYHMGGNRDLSGFEHTVVGEQKGGEVKGYHFWYKYYMDEHFKVPNTVGQSRDLIKVLQMLNANDPSPDVATLKYQWDAFDYVAGVTRPLTKPIGGFWIGPSAEALLAMGTLAFLPETRGGSTAEINGMRYRLKAHQGATSRNIRSFYAEFAGVA